MNRLPEEDIILRFMDGKQTMHDVELGTILDGDIPVDAESGDKMEYMGIYIGNLSLPSCAAAINDVVMERARQDQKWGGPSHDDQHHVSDFLRWIGNYRGWADMMADMGSMDKCRRRLVQIAALAVAAVELLDRKKA